jgi:hypothetical protein
MQIYHYIHLRRLRLWNEPLIKVKVWERWAKEGNIFAKEILVRKLNE